MENAKIELIKKTSMELPSVYTDGNQINQVLVNIIINAVQAMPEGGTLTIASSESVEFPPFNPTTQMKVVIINITDTGYGIDKDNKDKVFNPFFSTKEKGTGLGLTIVHRIIENLGGWVRIDNVEPHGTAFNIYIPTEPPTHK
jgi:signal transduction histidine kinase